MRSEVERQVLANMIGHVSKIMLIKGVFRLASFFFKKDD